jgi:hypothetical protein
MGALLCCCRRRRVYDSERAPLLPKVDDDTTRRGEYPLPPPTTTLERIADALAALRAGKLPDEQQLEKILDTLVRSDILNDDQAAAALSNRGRQMLQNVREVLRAAQEVGKEKNGE